MRNDLSVILTLVLFGIALMIVLKVFWPVLIILGALLLIGYFKTQHEIKKQQKQERQAQEDYESQLFREQVLRKKKENAEKIDAEFTEKEDNKYDSN